eukprot:1159813-Pelagomonas_calceolata.AAC.26
MKPSGLLMHALCTLFLCRPAAKIKDRRRQQAQLLGADVVSQNLSHHANYKNMKRPSKRSLSLLPMVDSTALAAGCYTLFTKPAG